VNAHIPPFVSIKTAVNTKLAAELKKIASDLPSAASLALPQIDDDAAVQ
jgi:hypothetical protein